MKPRWKRFGGIVEGVAALGVAAALVLNAFQSNLVFFFTPTQVVSKEAPQGRPFRIGGLVEEGSVVRSRDGLGVRFTVTNTARSVPISYRGFLPDLFRKDVFEPGSAEPVAVAEAGRSPAEQQREECASCSRDIKAWITGRRRKR